MFFYFVTHFVNLNSAPLNDLLFCVFTFHLLCRLWANTDYCNFPFNTSMLSNVVLSKSSFCCFDYFYFFWCMYRVFFCTVYYSYHKQTNTNKQQMHSVCIDINILLYICRSIYKILLIYIVHLLVWIINCTLYCFIIHTGLLRKTCSVIKLYHKTTQKLQISTPAHHAFVEK